MTTSYNNTIAKAGEALITSSGLAAATAGAYAGQSISLKNEQKRLQARYGHSLDESNMKYHPLKGTISYGQKGKIMTLTNKVYDTLQWVCRILIPAFITLYIAVNGVLISNGLNGLPYPEVVTGIVAAVNVFIGALMAKSSSDFKNSESVDTL